MWMGIQRNRDAEFAFSEQYLCLNLLRIKFGSRLLNPEMVAARSSEMFLWNYKIIWCQNLKATFCVSRPPMKTWLLSIVLLYILSIIVGLSDPREYIHSHPISPRALLMLSFLWCGTSLQWSSSWHFEGLCSHLKGQAVQDICCLSLEEEDTMILQNSGNHSAIGTRYCIH